MIIKITDKEQGERLDVVIAAHAKEISRSQAKRMIEEGYVAVAGMKVLKASHTVSSGERVELTIPEPKTVGLIAQDIPLEIIFEDKDIIVINKRPGMVVHPAVGNHDGTLVNALLHHCHDLAGISGELRPGIVHRLDKETSGVMIVAKNDAAMASLMGQFKARTVEKRYVALLWGSLKSYSGTISAPIGRSPVNRKKMSVRARHGRDAVTHYSVAKAYGNEVTFVDILLGTGRTHQIRVHFSSIGHPLLGDSTYGRSRQFKQTSTILNNIPRTMLHSRELTIDHPKSGKRMKFNAEMPQDMKELINELDRMY